jgi:putative transposase
MALQTSLKKKTPLTALQNPTHQRHVGKGKGPAAIGGILRDLCQQKGVEVLEGHAMPDHVHLCLKIPPKYSVSYTIGFLKGKSAVRVHRELLKERRMTGLHFWAAGYWVSTVGRDEAAVRRYIREQEHFDKGQGQLFE